MEGEAVAFVSFGLEDGCFCLQIDPEYQQCFGINIQGRMYQVNVLPFGWSVTMSFGMLSEFVQIASYVYTVVRYGCAARLETVFAKFFDFAKTVSNRAAETVTLFSSCMVQISVDL